MFTNKIIHQVWEGYSEKYIPIRLKNSFTNLDRK